MGYQCLGLVFGLNCGIGRAGGFQGLIWGLVFAQAVRSTEVPKPIITRSDADIDTRMLAASC